MNEALFRWINGWPEGWSGFFWFLSEATKQNWVRIVLGAFVLAMLLAGSKTRRATIMALIAWGLANAMTDVLKFGISTLRPCVELADVHLRVGRLTSFGTASAHAANMAAVAFAFTATLGRWGWPWIAIALLVGLSRIYVGVHYPSQVLLGWACGAFAGFLVVQMQRMWTRIRNSAATAAEERKEDESLSGPTVNRKS
jgi:undecaprenyl-diphosphatase